MALTYLGKLDSGYRVLGGSTYVTDGVPLIQVTGIDLSFPGFSTGTNGSQIPRISDTMKMTDANKSDFCLKAAGVPPTARDARRPPEKSMRIALCDGADCLSRRRLTPTRRPAHAPTDGDAESKWSMFRL